jgi:hypothetical protein
MRYQVLGGFCDHGIQTIVSHVQGNLSSTILGNKHFGIARKQPSVSRSAVVAHETQQSAMGECPGICQATQTFPYKPVDIG